MGQYILRRILISIPVLLIITFSIYVLIDLAPGDPTDFFINPELGVTEENLENLRARFALDQPLPVRYVNWLGQVLQGDLGYRFKNGDPVGEVLFERLKNTLILMAAALLLGWVLGVSSGIFTGLRQYSAWDFTLTGLSFIGISMPAFVAGIFGAGETVEILLDTSNPGYWMAHCHIAEHVEGGMMFNFLVKGEGVQAPKSAAHGGHSGH